MIVYKGELTREQAAQYGVEFAKCKACNSEELVISRAVQDVICESCGLWQLDYLGEN